MTDYVPRPSVFCMTPDERVRLVDAVMRSSAPSAFAEGVRSSFEIAGRTNDAVTAAVIATLHQSGEIEAIMHMRAEWLGQRGAAYLRLLG